MTKKKTKSSASGSKRVRRDSKKKKIVPLWPDDLPLVDIWCTVADLMNLFQVKRTTIDRYRRMGLLREHRWPTLRFNKTYVDWMIKHGGKKLVWVAMLLLNCSDYLMPMMELT